MIKFYEIKLIADELDNKLVQLELLECKLNTSTSVVKNGERDIESKKAKQEIILLKIAKLSKTIDELVAKHNQLYKDCLDILNENKYNFSLQEKNVVEYYYMDNLEWDEITKLMKKSKSHIWNLHRKIKKKFIERAPCEVA